MPDENLLGTLESNLRESRATRGRLASRLADLEAEAERLRTQLNEMDAIVSQTEAALFRILSSNYGVHASTMPRPSDAEIEAALRRDSAAGIPRGVPSQPPPYNSPQRIQPQQPPRDDDATRHHHIPPIRPDIEPKSDRFFERTISYAAAVLLRESGGPLHVNEIYNRLLEGGFQFTGQNPTISIAVSLNRNNRFRKVAPGTFDLVMRDAAQQVS
ncbi:MAG TPA: hypothetical protein VKB12_13670 [Pyrinomonadaceae bacterium]|nr:hypothetical protein [Pyrinomonadaceae bacterium]